jgi:hypothetical protein
MGKFDGMREQAKKRGLLGNDRVVVPVVTKPILKKVKLGK